MQVFDSQTYCTSLYLAYMTATVVDDLNIANEYLISCLRIDRSIDCDDVIYLVGTATGHLISRSDDFLFVIL
jgi:hypothetical protein